MNLSSPISSVVPGGRGSVLAVLARTEEPMSGRRIAELSGDKARKTWVNTLLSELVEAGVVLADSKPPSKLYRLNRDHLAAPAIEALANMRARLIEMLRDDIRRWQPAPSSAWLFGSVARGEGGVESDIDIAIVRSDRIDDDDSAWSFQVAALGERIRLWAGNEASVIEYAESELAALATAGEGIVRSIRAEGIHLGGRRNLLGANAKAL